MLSCATLSIVSSFSDSHLLEDDNLSSFLIRPNDDELPADRRTSQINILMEHANLLAFAMNSLPDLT